MAAAVPAFASAAALVASVFAALFWSKAGAELPFLPDGADLGTVEYDLWANVTSRIEVRYDKCLSSGSVGLGGTDYHYYLPLGTEKSYSVGLYANVVYKF